jgi:hypothetical protein
MCQERRGKGKRKRRRRKKERVRNTGWSHSYGHMENGTLQRETEQHVGN